MIDFGFITYNPKIASVIWASTATVENAAASQAPAAPSGVWGDRYTRHFAQAGADGSGLRVRFCSVPLLRSREL